MKPFAHTAAVLLLVALAQPAWAQIPQQGCGNEGEAPCPFELFNASCDTGLARQAYLFRPDICGCTKRDPIFGICLAPIECERCVNLSRRMGSVDQFVGSWADWALKNQRELAQDEPLNLVMQIATHNSYNTWADGHALVDFPNQIYSTTDQLRAGARGILFDNYYFPASGFPGARLCHSAFSTSNPVNLFTVAGLCANQLGNLFYPQLADRLNDPGFPLFSPGPSERYYSQGIKEIRNWLLQNPNEIVFLDFEEYVPRMPGGQDSDVLAPIQAYLGDMVLAPPPDVPACVTGSIATASFIGSISTGVLTVNAVLSGTLDVGDQINGASIPPGTVITGTGVTPGTYYLNQASLTGVSSETISTGVLTVTAVGSADQPNCWTHGLLHVGDLILDNGPGNIPDGTFIQSFGTGTGSTGTYNLNNTTLTVPSETIKTKGGRFPDRWPTRREMLAAGKRVIILDNAYNDFTFAKNIQPSLLFNQDDTVAGSYGDANGTWLAKSQRRFPNCFSTPDFTQDFKKTLFTKATIVVEERELGEFIGFSVAPKSGLDFGLMSDQAIVDATECNYSIITLDKYSQALVPPDGSLPDPVPPLNLPNLDYLIYTLKPDFHRQGLAVWSWKEGDRGQNGDCAMLEGSSGRWVSANCGNSQKFACAKPRSQSGKNPLDWSDPLGDAWGVTTASGPWGGGSDACQKEFPPGSQFGPEGYVFSVPVNGYQNRRLKDGSTAADNIWLDYSQHNTDDKWVIGGSSATGAPVAKAGPNQVVECGNSVNLDADGSYSRDGAGTLSYKWQGPFGIRTTQIVNLATPGDLPLGVDPILLAVTDSHGQTATDSLTVTVQDTTPPSLTVSLSTGSARRHSHFVPVRATITSKDSCDSEPPRIALLSIELVRRKDHEEDHEKDHEKDHDKSDIDTYFRGATFGTDDRAFELARGEEHDRTYIVTYSATDLSGNVTKISAQVVVEAAHDD